jgi:CRP-like cAMP-binding protein
MQLKELFERIDFFSGLDDKILRKLADAAVTRQYGPNEAIVRQGEMGLGLYIIVRGRVKVEREQPDLAPIKVAELGPEQFFAEMSIVDNKPRSATVTTMEQTECLLLTRDSFVTLMQKYPEIPIRVARLLAERLRAADEKLAAAPPKPEPAANGAKPAAGAAAPEAATAEESGSGKQKVQKSLLEAFQNLYTLKAFTRFSVAVLGCPVEGEAANVVGRIRMGDVKALVLPAEEPVRMRIAAREPGLFTLHVFVPGTVKPERFGPVEIDPGDDVAMLMEKGEVSLHRTKKSCDNN